jgi:hypothetical protein
MNKELCLGMTRFVCRYGTLSEAFDKLTPSQKYYQAVKETYLRANELKRLEANAKNAQADYLEAVESYKQCTTDWAQLRCKAKIELAELQMFELLVSVEDTWRQFDEFNKVRMELKEQVHTQYPEGIEQAELDNWKSVAEFKATKQLASGRFEDFTQIPLPPMEKAKISLENGHNEGAVAFVMENKHLINEKFQGDVAAFLAKKTGVALLDEVRK